MEVGGPCEGCEALYEYEGDLSTVDTIPGHFEFAQPLILTGVVYNGNGLEPASDILLYFYQTNPEGIYAPAETAQGWGNKHGQHRAWVKTDAKGAYRVLTYMPGAYPNRNEPSHIHITVKEPHTIPYYIDAIHFSNDSLLTPTIKEGLQNRGGSGICEVSFENGMGMISRDIYLGRNIPGYPEK